MSRKIVTSYRKWRLRYSHDHLADPPRVKSLDSSDRDGTRRIVKSVIVPAGNDVCELFTRHVRDRQ